jgi:phosphatidate cytidylyltransferase
MHKASVGGVIETAITGLTLEEQMDVIMRLSKHLVNQGALPSSVRRNLRPRIKTNASRSGSTLGTKI